MTESRSKFKSSWSSTE